MKNELTYELVYDFNLEIMDLILKKPELTDSQKRSLIKSFYSDPDGYPLKDQGYREHGSVICTADGLLSISRILKEEKFEDVLETYREFRRIPVVFFPKEDGGINQSRGKKESNLGDKIDLTLNDLKRYCEYREGCRLQSVYELPKTQAWIKSFNYSFGGIVDWMGLKGIFTDENYAVFDLEKDDGSTLNINTKYQSEWSWSKKYYQHIKDKIRLFMI